MPRRSDHGVGGGRGHRPRRGLGGASRHGADRPRRRRTARAGGGPRGLALRVPPLLLAPQGGKPRASCRPLRVFCWLRTLEPLICVSVRSGRTFPFYSSGTAVVLGDSRHFSVPVEWG